MVLEGFPEEETCHLPRYWKEGRMEGREEGRREGGAFQCPAPAHTHTSWRKSSPAARFPSIHRQALIAYCVLGGESGSVVPGAGQESSFEQPLWDTQVGLRAKDSDSLQGSLDRLFGSRWSLDLSLVLWRSAGAGFGSQLCHWAVRPRTRHFASLSLCRLICNGNKHMPLPRAHVRINR